MRRKGFTLIELLVVMTIISVLLGLSSIAFQSSRQAGRDAKRKADVEQIRSALEVYRSDYGGYPTSYLPSGALTCVVGARTNTYFSGSLDPSSPSSNYYYVAGLTSGTGCNGAGVTTYSVCARLETVTATLTAGQPCFRSCGSAGACNYEVDSP